MSPLSPGRSPWEGDSALNFTEGRKAVRVRRARMAGHLTQMQKKANEKREEEAKRLGRMGFLMGFVWF